LRFIKQKEKLTLHELRKFFHERKKRRDEFVFFQEEKKERDDSFDLTLVRDNENVKIDKLPIRKISESSEIFRVRTSRFHVIIYRK